MCYSPSIATNQVADLLTRARSVFPRECWRDIWLVGGGVRDALTGTSARDLDFVAKLPETALEQLGFRLVVGKSTLPIYFKALAGGETAEVVVVADAAMLLADLLRRDFTVNALALSLAGDLLDPGNGQADLAKKRLHVCSPAVFAADPLRIIRAYRFAAEGWRLSAATNALISQVPAAKLAMVPLERFSREMLKALAAADPVGFFAGLATGAAGSVFLPELGMMMPVPAGPPNKHPEGDLLTHSLQVLARVAGQTRDPLARFCALFHDLGKLGTAAPQYPRHHGHEEAGFLLARPLCDRLRLPVRYRTALAWVCRLHGKANRWGELRWTTRLKLAEKARKSGIESILPLIAAADKDPGTVLTDWATVLEVATLSAVALGITAEQLVSLSVSEKMACITQKRITLLRDRLARQKM